VAFGTAAPIWNILRVPGSLSIDLDRTLRKDQAIGAETTAKSQLSSARNRTR
jgi:hypothetical protein